MLSSMRTPRLLADRSLLEDEPFRSLFLARSMLDSRRAKDRYWRNKILKDLLKPPINSLGAVQTWVEMAFDEGKLPRQEIVKRGYFSIFAEFFWLLYQCKEEEAMNMLNQDRKNRKFRSHLNIRKGNPGNISLTNPPSKCNNRRRGRKTLIGSSEPKSSRGEVDANSSHKRKADAQEISSTSASSFGTSTQLVADKPPLQSESNSDLSTTMDSLLPLLSHTPANPNSGHIDGGSSLIPSCVVKSDITDQSEMTAAKILGDDDAKFNAKPRHHHLAEQSAPVTVEACRGTHQRQAFDVADDHCVDPGQTVFPKQPQVPGELSMPATDISLSRNTLIDPFPDNASQRQSDRRTERSSMFVHRIGPHNKGWGRSQKPCHRFNHEFERRKRMGAVMPKGPEGWPHKRHRFVGPIFNEAAAFPDGRADFDDGAQKTVHSRDIQLQMPSPTCAVGGRIPGDCQRDVYVLPPLDPRHSWARITGPGKRKERIDQPDFTSRTFQGGTSTRTYAKLPKPSGILHWFSRVPSTNRTVSSNVPNLRDVDQMLCHSGALGLDTLNNPGGNDCHWDQPDDAQEEISYHDNDENPNNHACPGCSNCEIGLARQSRLPLQGLPPIWAKSRQELCESFDWFRSYQGGVYHSGGIVKGYLLSAFASSRDKFHHDGRLIISHGGGKAESLHMRNGELVTQQAEDQLAQDKSVNALLTTHKDGRPLVLLIDDKYALFPYDLAAAGVTYAVLGFFIITHAWAEFQPAHNEQGRVVRYKFAFQWCQGQGDPWWISARCFNTKRTTRFSLASSASVEVPRPMLGMPSRHIPEKILTISRSEWGPPKLDSLYHECGHCKTQSPLIYSQGWACVNPECVAFWNIGTGLPQALALDYTDSFLTLLPTPRLSDTTQDLRPCPPAKQLSNIITTSHKFSKGWHCTKCGRLSCRFKWEHWECSHCQAIFKVEGIIRSSKDLNRRPKIGFHQHSISPKSGIIFSGTHLFSYGNGMGEFQTYILPWNRGRIHHICSRGMGNYEADKIFQEYQAHAADGSLAFRRWPLRSHKLRGPLLTNYFSQNAGEPYQYVGGTDNTVPLESKSAIAVQKALGLIKDRINRALQQKLEFNEVLSAAYMERQKMAFHSDSEKGLGPQIAGLSLGSPALMHFRLNPQYVTKGQDREIDITLLLCHGDVLVMEGAEVQTYYQHTVVPFNFRIAATARWIDPALNSA